MITAERLLHYNYLSPHEALQGKTPAEVAAIKCRYHDSEGVVAKHEVVTPVKVSVTNTFMIPELRSKRPIKTKRRPSRFHRRSEKRLPTLVAMRG